MLFRPFPLGVMLGEVRKAPGDFAVTLDKLPVVASQTEKGSQLLDCRGWLPRPDLFDVRWVGRYPFSR